jgi:5-methylcytosine-specific restriction endonuclease McrA
MKFVNDQKTIKKYILIFIDLIKENEYFRRKGYTIGQIPDTRGNNDNGVLRHNIFFGFIENEQRKNLLEINIPYEYDGNINAIRGRIAKDNNGHYILRSTNRMTTSGRINIREQIEDSLRNRIVYIDDNPWILICNIDQFDIDHICVVLDVIKDCREGIFFSNVPGEISNQANITEGAKQTVVVNKYERNSEARKQCIHHWGVTCQVCGFRFESFYGDYGAEYIHVHHLTPLSEIREQYQLNPIEDLRPICPNCHAMIHRSTPALTIDDLKAKMKEGEK